MRIPNTGVPPVMVIITRSLALSLSRSTASFRAQASFPSPASHSAYVSLTAVEPPPDWAAFAFFRAGFSGPATS